MRIGFAQLNPTVGDLAGNTRKILAAYGTLCAQGAELVLTPELAICGYPPQDLVFKSRFVPLMLERLAELHAAVGEVPLLVGYVDVNDGPGQPFRNAVALLQRGQPIQRVFKSLLPTYDVFDEDRYFEPATSVAVLELQGRKIGVTICEDIWTSRYLPRRLYGFEPVGALMEKGAELILNLSASPFAAGKLTRRLEMLAGLAAQHRVPIAYCNVVGGNDQLIFDGNSLAVGRDGRLLARLASFEEELAVIDLDGPPRPIPPLPSEPQEVHDALVLGLRDYLHKCGFKSAVLGLSGGIDSALVACLAAAALGPQNVLGVTMPTQYSSAGSVEDSRILAERLGIRFLQIPIKQSFEAVRAQFSEIFAGLPENEAEENMQPRLRGLTLMAISNKLGHLLLSTGNKSELSVGYCTLYGDMCGGLAVISDVPKLLVYRIAEWINRDREIIPRDTITKPPSAELKPDQRDQDTLPPYEILDPILRLYVEEQLSSAEIVAHGFAEETVRWVVRRVDLNEYKRAQAVPGLRVTSRAFGLGRRMPVAQRFVE
ncbi:MAG TPA: NAD+ synthase [Chthoniobacteraceae bacterium]|jgi:NAD+ synthetase|nr:NAD+ synthase [Chthoniobacteraceae bacterium]